MTTPEALTNAVRLLLVECFRGADSGSTWFLDRDGLLATAAALSAEQASREASAGGATIAGHVEHVRWFVALLNAYARGERPAIRWDESWSVREVDENGWRTLQAELEREFEALLGHLERGLDPEHAERLLPLLATVTHAAYHLGAVRQMALRLDPPVDA